MVRFSVSFAASLILLLASSSLTPARAGDGDVDYSAPYITVDPESGKLITVNPGPQLKSHAAPTRRDSAVATSVDTGTARGSDATVTASGAGSDDVPSGPPVLLVAVLAAIVVLAGVGYRFLGQGKMSDA